ncbi:hypothetical protein HZH66_015321 [Vespula vulgaris]|uniref:Uncharacterized protein n=1 Tax=Vespula vulgaris TaxID=7454 RepID=A0A834IZF5_VESVU|nr:hypothetical protein HZH66_015321 [Vespula vulgaris]
MENFCRVTSLSNILAWSKVWTLRRHGSSLMKLRKTLLASYGSPLMKLKVVVHKSFLPNHSKTAGDSFHYQLLYLHFSRLSPGLYVWAVGQAWSFNMAANGVTNCSKAGYGYHDNASAEAGAAKSGIGN